MGEHRPVQTAERSDREPPAREGSHPSEEKNDAEGPVEEREPPGDVRAGRPSAGEVPPGRGERAELSDVRRGHGGSTQPHDRGAIPGLYGLPPMPRNPDGGRGPIRKAPRREEGEEEAAAGQAAPEGIGRGCAPAGNRHPGYGQRGSRVLTAAR